MSRYKEEEKVSKKPKLENKKIKIVRAVQVAEGPPALRRS
jgi:hypothetical protein